MGQWSQSFLSTEISSSTKMDSIKYTLETKNSHQDMPSQSSAGTLSMAKTAG